MVGQAIFPEKEHKEWFEIQKNPRIDPASKIKCTVNTFFICNYETVVKGTLQDFGFLFDQKNEHASQCYLYELGLMFYILEARKLRDDLFKFYEYRPKFDTLLINGTGATVKTRSRAGLVTVNYPYSVHSNLFGPYTFKLKEADGLWLIQEAECGDERHEDSPPGTNFLSRIEEMKKRHEYEKSTKEPQKIKKKSPSPEELRDARKIEIYHEIFGYYRFIINGKNLLISFFTKDKHLYGHYGNIHEIPLFPINDNLLEFEWRPEPPYDEVYRLRFLRNQAGNVTKCLIQIEGQSYEGTKLTGPCHVYKD